MATRKQAAAEEKKAYARTELAEAVDETLGDADLWNDIVSENAVPPLLIKGLEIRQPTKEQVDEWVKNANLPDADRILMGDEVYDKLQELFKPLPLSAYRNFQRHFMDHMFGTSDVDVLGK